MDHPTDRITHTMTFVIPVVEHWLELAQWGFSTLNLTYCFVIKPLRLRDDEICYPHLLGVQKLSHSIK